MKLGVIGCGKMGTALVAGAIRAGAVPASNVIGVDPVPAAREQFMKSTGAAVADGIADLKECDVIMLATKPHDIRTVLRDLSDVCEEKSVLIVSIAAGITTASLEAAAAEEFRVIRAMPNTPALVGCGAAAYCQGTRNIASDVATARVLLESVGVVVEVPERLMDAVTGLSGSGPAYVYLIIEAMADGGVKQGLSRADAICLAAQTVMGAAKMVLETGMHPAVLKDMVTSPGGTTIAGLAALEAAGTRSSLIQAVEASCLRAQELGG